MADSKLLTKRKLLTWYKNDFLKITGKFYFLNKVQYRGNINVGLNWFKHVKVNADIMHSMFLECSAIKALFHTKLNEMKI